MSFLAQNKYKVVITDYVELSLDLEREELAKIDAGLFAYQCKTEEEVISVTRNADAIITNMAKINRRVIESLERCKIIVRHGIGFDNVDLVAATEKGIPVANVPDYCIDEVAEHALALILTCVRRVTRYDREIRKGIWDYSIGMPIYRLRGRNIGLLGFGKTARALAQKLAGLGCQILTYDPFIPEELACQHKVKLVDFKELLQVSDIISVHIPLSFQTRHMISEKELKLMKRTTFLVNTSRGPVIDEKALVRALEEGWIAGAGLDVQEVEPLTLDNPLLKLDNVTLTPHASWYSEEAMLDLRMKILEEIKRGLRGELPRSLVNLEVKERISK